MWMGLSEINWENHATQYSFHHFIEVDGESVKSDTFFIERRGGNQWAVLRDGWVLDFTADEFIYESFPSEMKEDFIRRTRFSTRQLAYTALQQYLRKWERLPGGWRLREEPK